MHSPIPSQRMSLRIVVGYCVEWDSIAHAIKTALLVGTLLALINHSDDLLSGHFAWRWVASMLLTYLVPFSVSTSGIVHGKWQKHEQA